MANPPKRRPTIQDVAREAGVSRATVSRVLNGGVWVSGDAHSRVDKAIKRTGYRINPHARSLATRRNGSVALLLTESYERFFEDLNFSLIMRTAAAALAERDYPLVLILADTEVEQRRAVSFMTGGHVDGALVLSAHRGRQAFLDDLIEAEVPLIAGGIPLGFENRVAYVQAEDREGARDMTRYLMDSGRKRIAHIAGPQDTSGGTGRLVGYREALGDRYEPALVAYGDYSRASGAEGMTALLDSGAEFDAVFAANDLMAVGALEVLAQRGLSVPGDVAVSGFDDNPVAAAATPPLTTMRQPFERVAREMVRLLLDMIDGGPPSRVSLPTELVRRESA
ncbi:MAG: LacI family transcriptional regulator [Demequinaceae bacterium]|nr:LacI family transcriptional regulator [Demequinaceae bacterium]